MTEKDLYDLIYSALGYADPLFELRLTITFAAILAVYFSSARITRYMRWLLVGLCASAAVLLAGRWFIAMQHVVYYRERLLAAEMTPLQASVPLGFLHGLMCLVGSLGTILFMATFARDDER